MMLFIYIPVAFSNPLAHDIFEDREEPTSQDLYQPEAISPPPTFDKFTQRFQPYGLNSAVYTFTEDDDAALRADYSFLFRLYDTKQIEEQEDVSRTIFFFSYSGQFDFYVGTRDSSPVINRISNPALTLYHIFQGEALDFVSFALEHRSNGQVVEIDERDESGNLKTQVAYNNDDYEYFDALSRGANYATFSFGGSHKFGKDEHDLYWGISNKIYVTDDTEVNWGRWQNGSTNIKDYDITRIGLKYEGPKFSDYIQRPVALAEYTIGKKFFDTDSIDISLILPLRMSKKTQNQWLLPITLTYHSGPMNTLSNYTKSVQSIGAGVTFWY